MRAQLLAQGSSQTQGAITQAVEAVVEREAVQAILRAGIVEAMGLPQRRPITWEGESAGFFQY